MEKLSLDPLFLPSVKDAERMMEIFNIYCSPGKCKVNDIMDLSRSYCAQFIAVRDNEAGGRIAGYMVIVPITDEYFAKFIKGETFGLGEAPYPEKAFPIERPNTDKFIIDCLMTDPEYITYPVWLDLLLQAVSCLDDVANGEAQIAAKTNLKTGHEFYTRCLHMRPVNKGATGIVYKTTLAEMTDVVMRMGSPSRR